MWFLYRHVRLDKNVPFYIGMGACCLDRKTNRSYYARAYAKSGRNRYWKNITKKTGIDIEILLEAPDREFIEEKEREFIALYGLSVDGGSLCNSTYGGDNSFSMSSSAKLAISKKLKGNKNCLNRYNIPNLSKKIICNETGERFPSITECSRQMFLGKRSAKNAIIKAIKQKTSYKNFTFNYL